MDWELAAFCEAPLLKTTHTHTKSPKTNSSFRFSWVTLAAEEMLSSFARHTAQARKYSPNRNAWGAEVKPRQRCFSHTRSAASCKLFMITRVTKAALFLLLLCVASPHTTLSLNSDLQGEPCLMGVKRIYRKLKPTSRCVMGKTYSVSMTSGPCDCTEADFEWWLIIFVLLSNHLSTDWRCENGAKSK